MIVLVFAAQVKNFNGKRNGFTCFRCSLTVKGNGFYRTVSERIVSDGIRFRRDRGLLSFLVEISAAGEDDLRRIQRNSRDLDADAKVDFIDDAFVK